MKLCYQVATPDVAIADSVTAYQGPLAKSFGDLAALGYDGVELMTLDPTKLDWAEVKAEAEEAKAEKKISSSMKKDELIAYAKEHGIEIDEKATKAVIIETIESALK